MQEHGAGLVDVVMRVDDELEDGINTPSLSGSGSSSLSSVSFVRRLRVMVKVPSRSTLTSMKILQQSYPQPQFLLASRLLQS